MEDIDGTIKATYQEIIVRNIIDDVIIEDTN